MPVKIGNINASLNGIAKVIINGEIYYQLGSTYLRLIKDTTVSVATTSVTIDTDENSQAFSFGKDSTLLLVSDIVNNANNSAYYLYANNNQISTNYYRQELSALDTTVAGGRINENKLSAVTVGNKTLSIAEIKLTNDGYYTFASNNTYIYNTTSIGIVDEVTSSTFTLTNLTRFDVVANVTNAIGVDSRFMLLEVIN